MIFVASCIFLILSLFLSCSRFFIISVNSSGLFLWYVETSAEGSSLLWVRGGRSSFNDILAANSNPLFISVVGYSFWGRVTCNSSWRVFLRFLLATIRDGFYVILEGRAFEMEVLFDVSGVMVNVCDNLTILNEDVYKW